MSRECLEEFIKIYECAPCLWHVKSKEYHDRTKREAAYVRLIEKLKAIEPNANKEAVIKKINNIRSAYRKEVKKIKASVKSGSGTEEVYEPKMWYFSLLRFLDDQETPRSSCSNIASDDEDTSIEERAVENTLQDTQDSGTVEDTPSVIFARVDENLPETIGTSAPPRRNRALNKRSAQEADEKSLTNEVLLTVKDHFKKPNLQEDRFDIVGKIFAMKLRGLPKEQMLIAEKIMNNTLFLAEMGKLTLSHKLICHHFEQQLSPYRSPIHSPSFSHSSTPSPPLLILSATTRAPQAVQPYQQQEQYQEEYYQQEHEKSATSFISNFNDIV